MHNLLFSKSQLIQDIFVQNKQKISIAIGKINVNNKEVPVIYTEACLEATENEYKDADLLGKGIFFTDIEIDRDILLNIVKESQSQEDCYRLLSKHIN